MEWYEIIGAILIIILGVIIRGKLYERWKDRDFNGSWRTRKK